MRTQKEFKGKHFDITGKILGAFFEIHKEMGHGFAEKVYETALAILLEEQGLTVERQRRILVYFRGKVVGEFIADMIVNGVVLVELKSVDRLIPAHDAQLLNYLKATEIEVGLLLNFGPIANFHRKIYDNERKGSLNWMKR